MTSKDWSGNTNSVWKTLGASNHTDNNRKSKTKGNRASRKGTRGGKEKMRLYSVENINKVFDKPVKVYAETAREAIKKAFGIENVRQDKYGNIVVCGVCNKREDNPRVMRWVYKEVGDE